jgi:predicted metal-dependent enzyme (double-stranded beta helix superfamily)
MPLTHLLQPPVRLKATPDPLDRFVTDVARLRHRHADDYVLANVVAERLGPLVRNPGWLAPAHRQPWPDRYRQHVLYVAPDGGFSVVSLVWRPGQRTPIHDHVSWCVVGVLEGEERETQYHLYRDASSGERFLVEESTHLARPGQTEALVPPDEDIHCVWNSGRDIAISIHVYGADIGTLGSSINRRFDDLPVRSAAGNAEPVRWRQA